MLFELLKKVDEVEITDKLTKEKKVIKTTTYYLKGDGLDKLIRIEPHTFKVGEQRLSNKDILNVLATLINQ